MKTKFFVMLTISVLLFSSLTGCSYEENINSNSNVEKNVEISYVEFDWPYYNTLEALSERATNIYEGKVVNIFFDIVDIRSGKSVKGKEITETRNIFIKTVYEIKTTAFYKGNKSSRMYIGITSGMESYKISEQISLWESVGIESGSISVAIGFNPLELGETYLFFTRTGGGDYENIVNFDQFAYNENYQKDYCFSYSEAKEFVKKNF